MQTDNIANPIMMLNLGSEEIELSREEISGATSADFPPFEFFSLDENGNNQIIGFDIAVANAIGEEINSNIIIEDRDFTTLFDSLANDEFDFVIAALNETPERLEVADFSDPYYSETIAFLSNGDSPILELEDLSNRTIGAQEASSGIGILEELQDSIEELNIVTFDEQEEIVAAVETGEIDGAVTVDVVAEFIVNDNPSLSFKPFPELGGFEARIAFPNESPLVNEFNVAIANLKEDGVLEDLEEEFFGTDSDEQEESYESGPKLDFGTVEDDLLIVENSSELVFSGSGNDLIDASNSRGNNRIYGSAGDDTFILGRGDTLSGGEGEDVFLNQSAGENIVTGGAGADQFWIAVAEIPDTAITITDLELDVDVIGVAGIGASSTTNLNFRQDGSNAIVSFNDRDLAIFQEVDAISVEQNAFFSILT